MHFLFFNFLILANFLPIVFADQNTLTESSQLNQPSSPDKQRLPNFIQKHGKIGVNFNIDTNNNPYIWCEKYERSNCQKSNSKECTTRVRCYADLSRSHRLGCMAVRIYNTSSLEAVSFDNSTNEYHIREPDLKGCWSQGESELRECVSDRECIVDTRRTGTKERAAKFCCCRTHECNKKFVYKPSDVTQPLLAENMDESEDDSIWVHLFYVSLIVFLFVAICVACIILFFTLRKQADSKKTLPHSDWHNLPSLLLSGQTDESVAFLNGQPVDLNNIVVIKKTSNGRFAQVFQGHINGTLVAIKSFSQSDVASWVNEQEIYSMKAIKSHENFANFLGAAQREDKFWLVTLFYEKGSLFDFLKFNKPDLVTAVKMITTTLNGLAFLHEEIIAGNLKKPTIVHRDFKSKNILMKDDLTTCIADFGLALKCENMRMSADENHVQVGTRRYMSPEVLEGATEFSSFAFQQIDVYAAGLVLWEVMSRTVIPGIRQEEIIPEFALPYEHEVGTAPTLTEMRELVVTHKYRPQMEQLLDQNQHSVLIVKTISEMWDSEPDGRITSGCARDRFNRLCEALRNDSSCRKE